MEDTTTAIAAALGQVGPRLKQLRSRRGVTLGRTPGGVQAWKINVPASNSEPSPESHEGYEWLFALSGRMRLVLGGPRPCPRRRRGGRVRHPGVALVRQHRQRRRRSSACSGHRARARRPERGLSARRPLRNEDGVTHPLMATKLYVPKLRRGLVARPRLLERMGNGAEARLTLVSAPAGFGKTTVLAAWLHDASADGRCVA